MPIPTFPDWQEAAEKSKQKKAISVPFDFPAYSKSLKKPVIRSLEIVKPLHGDPYFVYAKTGIKFVEERCTAGDCDRIKRWKSY